MSFETQKRNILKKKVVNSQKLTGEQSFLLKNAEEGLSSIPIFKKKRRIGGINDDINAFGEENLKKPEFKKRLRNLQEKYKLTAFV